MPRCQRNADLANTLSPALAPPPCKASQTAKATVPIPTELEQTCGQRAVPRQSGAKGPSTGSH